MYTLIETDDDVKGLMTTSIPPPLKKPHLLIEKKMKWITEKNINLQKTSIKNCPSKQNQQEKLRKNG